MHSTIMSSPVGDLLLVAEGAALVRVEFARSAARAIGTAEEKDMTARAREELGAYFSGALDRFTVPMELRGTAFQKAVWEALREIPLGACATYGEIARAVRRPAAVRAVGGANHVNPIAILVPCHRVIGENGSLTGYAGGLEKKKWLLEHERRVVEAGGGAQYSAVRGARGYGMASRMFPSPVT